MKKSISKSARAGLLALALTSSCSLVGNDGGGNSYSCLLSSGNCIQTASVSDCFKAGGSVVDFCQEQSSDSGARSSSSSLASSNVSSSSQTTQSSSGGAPSGGSSLGACVEGTVKIGTQTWQKCNLNAVPSTGKSSCYDNDTANCTKYGRLYDWAAAKSACPSGWHLPSDAEWDALVNYAGGSSTAGTKLKARSGWNKGGAGTDDYGFAALPGGVGSKDGNFWDLDEYGVWWSASEKNNNDAYSRYVNRDENANRDFDSKNDLLSVRCLKN